MFGYQRIVIADHERGLLFQDRTLHKILTPGVYHLWNPFGRRAVQVCDINDPVFPHAQADFWVQHNRAGCAEHLQPVRLGSNEVGIVYYDEVFNHILPPGSRRVFWRGPVAVRTVVQNIDSDYQVAPTVAKRLLGTQPRALAEQVLLIEIPDHHLGLLVVDGVFTATLPPGLHGFWRFHRHISIPTTDQRVQVMEVSGQEILTRDKVSLRLNLSAEYRIVDAVKARTQLTDVKAWLYLALQLALRQAVGTQSLDTLLADKSTLNQAIFDEVLNKAAEHGIALLTTGIKDIVLPGEMREILNQVVMAEKQSQANLIRRREETAATRSLLNTAKLMDDHPTLLRLKELETLENVVTKVDQLNVYSGIEGVLKDLVRIRTTD